MFALCPGMAPAQASEQIDQAEDVLNQAGDILSKTENFYNQVEDIQEDNGVTDIGFDTQNDGSIMYKIMADAFLTMRNFTLNLTEDMGKKIRPILKIVLTIYIFFVVIRMMQTGKFDLVRNLYLIAGLTLATTVILDPENFDKWVYKPIIGTSMQTAAYILETSSGEIIKTADPLQGALDIIQNNVLTATEVANTMVKAAQTRNGGWLNVGFSFEVLKAVVLGGIITLAYYALMFVFGVIYTLGIIAAHILLICSPFAVMLGAVPAMRGLLFNWLKSTITYALIPVFASIAMGATLFMLAETQAEALEYLNAVNASSYGLVDQPQGLYIRMLLLALFSIFFHLKSSEFASQLVGGPITNFGQVFGAAMTSGLASAKLATGPAIHALGGRRAASWVAQRTEGIAVAPIKQGFNSMKSFAGQFYQSKGK
jgi:type IV secretory pathway VirB6-like protein